MKRDISFVKFLKFCDSVNLPLTREKSQMLEEYSFLLKEWNKKINLVSNPDTNFIIERHIIPSFYFIFHLNNNHQMDGKRLLDMGTGAGLPGIPMAIFFDRSRIVLLDSNRKKSLFLRKVCQILGLNAEVVCERVEKLNVKIEDRFDIVTARAVTSLGNLVGLVRPVVNHPGYLYTIKGLNYNEEWNATAANSLQLDTFPPNKEWLDIVRSLDAKTLLKLEF